MCPLKRRTAIAIIGLAAALLVSGCGGQSDRARSERPDFTVIASTTMTTGSITRPEFVTQVNQLCRREWITILDNFAKYRSWQSPRPPERQLFAQSVRLSFLAGLDFHIFDEIRRIRAPRADKTRVEEVIGRMQTAVERGQRELHTYTPAQLSKQFAEYNRAARKYGLRDCLVDGKRLQHLDA
jgi:hypothetical protein